MKLILLIISLLVCKCLASIELEGFDKPSPKQMAYIINEKFNASWKAGPTKFDEWSMASIKRLMG